MRAPQPGRSLPASGAVCRDGEPNKLRTFVIAGDLVYISYFYFAPEVPLWGGVFWSAVFMLVNAVMIARILADRTPFRISDEELQLFNLLETLSPGEFRQIIKVGRWRTATEATVLTEENRPLENLYYVLDGDIVIEKSGCATRTIGPRAFIGEVAFLLPQPASATVTVAAGARYVTWNNAALRRRSSAPRPWPSLFLPRSTKTWQPRWRGPDFGPSKLRGKLGARLKAQVTERGC